MFGRKKVADPAAGILKTAALGLAVEKYRGISTLTEELGPDAAFALGILLASRMAKQALGDESLDELGLSAICFGLGYRRAFGYLSVMLVNGDDDALHEMITAAQPDRVPWPPEILQAAEAIAAGARSVGSMNQ